MPSSQHLPAVQLPPLLLLVMLLLDAWGLLFLPTVLLPLLLWRWLLPLLLRLCHNHCLHCCKPSS